MTTRRELLIALAALTLPLGGHAQQPKVARLGVLAATNPGPALPALREGLRELGYREGRNILFEVRIAHGKPDPLDAMAAELVRLKVDVIVAFQTPAVQAAKRATGTLPIVMQGAGDPVATGLIASLARPGGNITGTSGSSSELAAKNLEIFREIRPATKLVAVLANAGDPFTTPFLAHIQSAGRLMGMEIRPALVRGPQDYDAVFSEWAKARVEAVVLQPSLPRERAIELALKHRLLSNIPSLSFADRGTLFSYGVNPKETAGKTAIYVDKILKGAKPADLPVEQPTKFELVINLKTAKAIGVGVPRSVLARADRVIE